MSLNSIFLCIYWWEFSDSQKSAERRDTVLSLERMALGHSNWPYIQGELLQLWLSGKHVELGAGLSKAQVTAGSLGGDVGLHGKTVTLCLSQSERDPILCGVNLTPIFRVLVTVMSVACAAVPLHPTDWVGQQLFYHSPLRYELRLVLQRSCRSAFHGGRSFPSYFLVARLVLPFHVAIGPAAAEHYPWRVLVILDPPRTLTSRVNPWQPLSLAAYGCVAIDGHCEYRVASSPSLRLVPFVPVPLCYLCATLLLLLSD